MSEPFLSVVIPAFNEEARIGKSLEDLTAFLQNQNYSWEIVVVDDGSLDRTVEVATEKLQKYPHRIIQNQQNRGKGYVVRQGMLATKGTFRLFTDADLSTPIEEVHRFIHHMEKDGYDCVIGSRALPQSSVQIRQNPVRESLGKTFNVAARVLSFRGIHDSQCGFKCFKGQVATDLFSRQKLDGFSFDAEILFLAQKLGYRILEAPVTWRNSPQSRVNMLRDPFRMIADLLRIRWLHRQ